MNLDSARQAFVEEVLELLQAMEDALLALEEDPRNPESLNEVFRAMHTIKGTGGVFGYSPVVEFTHAVETLMDEIRAGQRPLTKPLIAILFDCRDHTASLVDSIAASEPDADGEYRVAPALMETGAELLDRLNRSSGAASLRAAAPCVAAADHESAKQLPVSSDLWMITLEFRRDAFRDGIDPLTFLRYLATLGELVHVQTRLRSEPTDADTFDPESCYLCFAIALRSDADKRTIASVFEFADQDCDIRILEPDSAHARYLELLAEMPDERVGCLGELLVSIGALIPSELERALSAQDAGGTRAGPTLGEPPTPKRRLGEILVEQGSIKPSAIEQAVQTQEAARARRQEESHFIRVDARRLGHLIDLVGELVTSSAAIRIMVDRAGIEDASEVVDGVEYLVSEIRDNALQLRMVPIGESLSRFRRVVRDVSQELGKRIELVVTGGETELDKTVVEKMTDPLTHLIRNAVDHGIESPEIRAAHGKPELGTIAINAFHDSGHIVIEIADDGAGLDAERIRAKAEARGLVRLDEPLAEAEVFKLIFAAGLSTKDEATNLSGRGVGMDVVRSNIEALRGSIELDSQLGVGTKISISLPLTLAIIDGFLVAAGQDQYVIPLSQVAECVEMNAVDERQGRGERYINLRGEVLPYIRLSELFNNAKRHAQRQRESLVVVRFGHQKMGLVVDSLLGELQTVIKPLGRVFERLRGVAGATILGTGDIALILDVTELAAIREGGKRSASSVSGQ